MKRSVYAILLVLMMILSAACGTAGQGSSSVASAAPSSDASEEEDYGEIMMFSVPELKAGKAELAGAISMTAGGRLVYSVTAEEGTGFFVACSTVEKDKVAADELDWLYYCATSDGNEINETVEITADGDYYIYVGSLGGELKYLSGNADWTTPEGLASGM